MVGMKYQWMISINHYLKQNIHLSIPLALILVGLTKVFYLSFAFQIITMVIMDWTKGILLALLSAIGFTLLTIIRDQINAPRPYEVLHISPVMPKDTKGHSFPSRHTFSSVLISGNWIIIYMVQPSLWIMVMIIIHLVMTIYIMISRVVLTLHFPKDIVAGLVSGILWVILEVVLFAWF